MRRIKRAGKFKRDFKRLKKSGHWSNIKKETESVIRILAADQPLPIQYLDRPLKGNLKGYRECHIKPDLILIYRAFKDGTLQLARLGSHSQSGI